MPISSTRWYLSGLTKKKSLNLTMILCLKINYNILHSKAKFWCRMSKTLKMANIQYKEEFYHGPVSQFVLVFISKSSLWKESSNRIFYEKRRKMNMMRRFSIRYFLMLFLILFFYLFYMSNFESPSSPLTLFSTSYKE